MSDKSPRKSILKQIDIGPSPFARFDEHNNLSCIVCRLRIKNKLHWNSHLRSREHIQALERLKANTVNAFKRESGNTIDGKELHTCEQKSSCQNGGAKCFAAEGATTIKQGQRSASSLPEGFFDSPVLDAKIRNVEYRDKIDIEYELFQKSIAKEIKFSEKIEQEDDHIRENDRLISDTDDLIARWRRIEDLHIKLEGIFTGTFSLTSHVGSNNEQRETTPAVLNNRIPDSELTPMMDNPASSTGLEGNEGPKLLSTLNPTADYPLTDEDSFPYEDDVFCWRNKC